MNISQAREVVILLGLWREAARPICDLQGTAFITANQLRELRLMAASHDGSMSRLADAIARIMPDVKPIARKPHLEPKPEKKRKKAKR